MEHSLPLLRTVPILLATKFELHKLPGLTTKTKTGMQSKTELNTILKSTSYPFQDTPPIPFPGVNAQFQSYTRTAKDNCSSTQTPMSTAILCAALERSLIAAKSGNGRHLHGNRWLVRRSSYPPKARCNCEPYISQVGGRSDQFGYCGVLDD